MFIIFLFSIILIVWFYTKTLNFRLNLYLINNNVNVGIATLKDKDLVVVNNKKYPLLSVFKYFCDRIAVMYFGEIVELADSDELFKK